MKIIPKFQTAIRNYKYERQNKLINKYCKISPYVDSQVIKELFPLRKGFTDYVKSKGLKIEIFDAERNIPESFYTTTYDYLQAKNAVKDSLQIRIRRIRPLENYDGSQLLVADEYIPKNKTEDGIGFLNNFYRAIDKSVNALMNNIKK